MELERPLFVCIDSSGILGWIVLWGLVVATVLGGLVFILSLLTVWRWQWVAVGVLGWFRWLLHPVSALLSLAVRWREGVAIGILGRLWRPLSVLHLR